jgi:protein-tyrosine kinase
MSRIEQALEKAALLRKTSGNGAAMTKEEGNIAAQTVPQCPLPAAITGSELKLQVENPLIATLCDPHSPASEEYRKLKSSLVAYMRKDEFKNVIMVTSSVGCEGKSMTAINLAITLAQEFDHTVLLIDADLRKPSIHDYLGMETGKGLSDYLSDGAVLSDLLIKIGIGRLTLLPAGTPSRNPVELFSSQKMKDFIAEIKKRYPDRFIIIDTPPVLPFAETRLIGALVDGIVFVVREGQTTLENINESINALGKAKLVGTVYNDASVQSLSDRYHYGYYGYRYGKASSDSGSQTADHRPRTTNPSPLTTDHRPRTTDPSPLTTDHGPKTTDSGAAAVKQKQGKGNFLKRMFTRSGRV